MQHADALLTPSLALMRRYESLFGDALPELRDTIPYFLELPEAGNVLPPGLDDGTPFVVAVGRIEPRKGSDLAMRAFSAIADEHPELKLVFLGKPMWHQGESIDEVIAANVAPRHRNRIVRLGNVPREQALAAARAARAFLHPAPWDNYPCATLEAMGMGAACVVSDQGGQSEMVEHERSGLVFAAGDAGALAASMRRMVGDDEFAERMRVAAKSRVADITDPGKLLERKIGLFDRIVRRERERHTDGPNAFTVPVALRTPPTCDPLPGRGLVVLDAQGGSDTSIRTTRDSLLVELGASPEWDVAVFVAPGQTLDVPSDWTRFSSVDEPVWLDRADDQPIVWVRAGVRLDPGRMQNLVAQVLDAPVPCGSFLWLRPKDARAFPYPPDVSWHDLLIGGRALPQIFAAEARHLKACRFLSGLHRVEHRLAALMAATAASGGMLFQHTGTICGDSYEDLPVVEQDTQLRAFGYLDVLGLAPPEMTAIGNLPIPLAPTADLENLVREAREAGRREARQEAPAGSSGGRNGPTKAAPVPATTAHDSGTRVDSERLAQLEQVYREHMALKYSKPARWLRKLGLFGAARRLFPKSKKALGTGD